MKARNVLAYIFIPMLALILLGNGCGGSEAERKDRKLVDQQQRHYQRTQTIPFFDYSIPRDIYTQIYAVVCTEARATYTVIESVTGETKFHGPSLGYGIPADTNLTNPLQPAYGRHDDSGAVIEQAEPNGLFSSQNTDGTWVLFVQADGSITPVYTEHKVTTYPFVVKKVDGEWVRADDKPASFTVDVSRIKK